MTDTISQTIEIKNVTELYPQEDLLSEVLKLVENNLMPDLRPSDCHRCKNATWFTSYRDLEDNKPSNLTLYCSHLTAVIWQKYDKQDNMIVAQCDGHRIIQEE